MSRLITAFPRRSEFEKAKAELDALSLPYEVISPERGYVRVGVSALVVEPKARQALAGSGRETIGSGWVDYRSARISVPVAEPPRFAEEVFESAAIMVLAPCVADETKIRIIAHLAGDLAEVFPYLNAEMRSACYNRHGPTFTFMDGYRMVSIYPRRIAVAKADEIVDAWRTLEMIRRRANAVWARRQEIEPCYERREKPPALEIFKRLPRTNCGACGEMTCLAFAVKLWSGEGSLAECEPMATGAWAHLKAPLIEICRGLGLVDVLAGVAVRQDPYGQSGHRP